MARNSSRVVSFISTGELNGHKVRKGSQEVVLILLTQLLLRTSRRTALVKQTRYTLPFLFQSILMGSRVLPIPANGRNVR